MEVPRIVLGPAGLQAPTGVTRAQGFDLDDFGAKPGEGFGAGGPSLELREVHDANILETIEVDVHGHSPSVFRRSQLLSITLPPYQRPPAHLRRRMPRRRARPARPPHTH